MTFALRLGGKVLVKAVRTVSFRVPLLAAQRLRAQAILTVDTSLLLIFKIIWVWFKAHGRKHDQMGT